MQNSELIKSIEKITEAKSVTEAFLERSSSIAEWIGNQMQDLGVQSVLDGKYKLHTVRSSVGADQSLYRIIDEQYCTCMVRLDCKKLSAERETFYFWNDFSAAYQRPCRDDVIQLAKDAPAIIEELAACAVVPELPEVQA